jgi:glycosyltransferase involved in cell wall biosynthesis
MMVPRKRILVVSDSLGTPIHARGIFNFTCSLVQIIKKLGHEVVLLVEPPDAGLIPQLTQQRDLGKATAFGTKRGVLSDIFRHFEGERFRFDWDYRDPDFQKVTDNHPSTANFRLAVEDTKNAKKQIYVEIPRDELAEFGLSQYSEHLKLFDGLLLHAHVYSESFRRGFQNLRPVAVNAEGFDFVILDTPHYNQFHGIATSNIIYVIHDFIPLYVENYWFYGRRLFARKLECTVSVGRNAIFNSETTAKAFSRIFGNDVIEKSAVIYPPIREEVTKAAMHADRRPPSNYIRDIQENKNKEQIEWAEKIRGRTPSHQKSGLFKSGALLSFNFPKWEPNLPFFCSILSDEPRKNIAALVEASKSFVGKANFLIMGQINGNGYMQECPENFPNLHFTGYVSDVQKFDLLRSCKAFIFPSLREGFGIPIVEAALFGAPIICTDTAVFREATFDKAAYFDPGDQGSLVDLIRQALVDRQLEAKGLELRNLVSSSFNQDIMAKRVAALLS